jgi:hypothetical protein
MMLAQDDRDALHDRRRHPRRAPPRHRPLRRIAWTTALRRSSFAFFASLGLPGLSGFIAEIMTFVGAFNGTPGPRSSRCRRGLHRLLPDHAAEGLSGRHPRPGTSALPGRRANARRAC